MSQQITQARAALAAAKGLSIDTIVEMGISLVPLFRSLFDAIAEGFKRIGLRGKVEALTEANNAQQDQLDKLQATVEQLAQRVVELEARH